LRIISDERLSGAPREAVQTRLDLWLKTHIEKLLGPLFELAKAEDVTGIARGIAFQLIEALGVLERSKIAAEMKDLDQPSRASLRKYGVRFGAYHIYLPALLKPAARALASLLWAQKQDDIDFSALSGAQHLAGSGRTSFPVDKQLPRDAYRVLGYRQCGERAVRVDILERLADLIRPALSWRETSPGEKPAGAFDGRGFVVTQAMTSLTGSAGEDFASILRALGYRMERRAPLPPKPAPAVAATTVETTLPEAASETLSEAAAVEAAAATAGVVAEDAPAAADSVNAADAASDAFPPSEDAAPVASATLLPNVAFSQAATADEPAAVEAKPVEGESIEALPEPLASIEPAPAEVAPAEATPVEAAQAEAAQDQAGAETTTETTAEGHSPPVDAVTAAAPEAVAAPELIEVWRPGGRSDERRPRHDRSRHRHQDHRPREGAAPAAAATSETGEAVKHERHRRGRRDRNQEFGKPRTDAPIEAAAPVAEGAPVGEPREDKGRPSRERFRGREKDADQRKGKFAGGRDNGGRDKGGRDKGGRDKGGRDSGPSHRQYATSAAPRERDRPVDPNSPFAKLAALKDQLAANRKDR
jgi:ATP-dependent RNA helicase SUPV3L1/SUV3